VGIGSALSCQPPTLEELFLRHYGERFQHSARGRCRDDRLERVRRHGLAGPAALRRDRVLLRSGCGVGGHGREFCVGDGGVISDGGCARRSRRGLQPGPVPRALYGRSTNRRRWRVLLDQTRRVRGGVRGTPGHHRRRPAHPRRGRGRPPGTRRHCGRPPGAAQRGPDRRRGHQPRARRPHRTRLDRGRAAGRRVAGVRRGVGRSRHRLRGCRRGHRAGHQQCADGDRAGVRRPRAGVRAAGDRRHRRTGRAWLGHLAVPDRLGAAVPALCGQPLVGAPGDPGIRRGGRGGCLRPGGTPGPRLGAGSGAARSRAGGTSAADAARAGVAAAARARCWAGPRVSSWAGWWSETSPRRSGTSSGASRPER
jgi:hypothetical protein